MSRILCIEDDIDVIETCRLFLEEKGHHVDHAFNGRDGYAKAKDIKPELIVLDVMMDDETDGFHVAYKIRRDEELKYIPILMLTSVNEKSHIKVDPAKDKEFLPVDAFLEKPVVKDKLLATAKRLLALSKEQVNVSGDKYQKAK